MIETDGMRCRGALRRIEADFGSEHADTFLRDLYSARSPCYANVVS
jgi:hypothetical protein